MRLSVVMAAYNAEATVAAAVRSVLAQTHRDFELVVVEDGSSDTTPDILAALAAEDARIRVLANGSNCGLPTSLRTGVAAARGQYVARMDADDLCVPERFAVQLAFLDAHPHVGVVGSLYRLFTDDPDEAWVDERHDRAYSADGIRHGRTPIAHPTACFRRELAERFGSYDPAWQDAEDHELWERWYSHGVRFAVLPERLLLYRVHPSSITSGRARRVVARSLRVNRRALLQHRIKFTPAGYRYVAAQACYLGLGWTGLTRLVGRGRDQATGARRGAASGAEAGP